MNVRVSVHSVLAVVAATVMLHVTSPAAIAQDQQEAVALEWSETMESGSTLFLHNVNGGITVQRSAGREAEVVATKRWRRGDPQMVRVEARRTGGGQNATVCAFWNEGASCDEERYTSGRNMDRSRRDNDVSVRYRVQLPDGVRLFARTVNGAVEITNVTGSVDARTTNGAISASSVGGPVVAETVNGAINVKMGAVGTEDLEYQTVNGAITIELPEDYAGHVSLRTVNGSIQTDFPLKVQGRINPRRIEAQIGEGGARLRAETVNGGVRLRSRY